MHYQIFFFCLNLTFKEKLLVKPHHFTDGMLAKLATFVIILVATIFFIYHGDQNGRSLEQCFPFAKLLIEFWPQINIEGTEESQSIPTNVPPIASYCCSHKPKECTRLGEELPYSERGRDAHRLSQGFKLWILVSLRVSAKFFAIKEYITVVI